MIDPDDAVVVMEGPAHDLQDMAQLLTNSGIDCAFLGPPDGDGRLQASGRQFVPVDKTHTRTQKLGNAANSSYPYEGGIRVGLLAQYPGQQKGLCSLAAPPKPCDLAAGASACGPGEGNCIGPGICANAVPAKKCNPDPAAPPECTSPGDGVCETLSVRTPVVASMVDLFPTIAAIAGIPLNAEGRAQIGTSPSASFTDGRSFLWAIENPGAVPPAYERLRAFASYPADKMTVVTHDDDPVNQNVAYKVCSYDSGVPTPLATNQRRVMGGSCVHPSQTSPSNDCTQVRCKLPGSMCVAAADTISNCPETGETCLRDPPEFEFDPTESDTALLRCSDPDDCPTGLSCTAKLWIWCNAEESKTLWKLKVPENASDAGNDDNELYDLRTNPEEEQDLNCHEKDVDGSLAISTALFNTSDGLENWHECVTGAPGCTPPIP